MGNQIVKGVSKKGTDKLDPSPYSSLLDIPIKALLSSEDKPIKEIIE